MLSNDKGTIHLRPEVSGQRCLELEEVGERILADTKVLTKWRFWR